MDIKYIILDFGKVLAGPTTGHWFITPKFIELVDMNKIDVNKFNESKSKLNYILDRKIETKEEEYKMFCEFYKKIFESLDYDNITEELITSLAYDMTYSSSKYTIYDGVKEELEELSSKYTLILLSDNWPCVIDIMKEYDIYKYFNRVYVSSIYGCTKSDGVFFDYPINDYDIKPGEAIFVDDNENLLSIAKSKGLDVRLMDRYGKITDSNYTIINDLKSIVEQKKY